MLMEAHRDFNYHKIIMRSSLKAETSEEFFLPASIDGIIAFLNMTLFAGRKFPSPPSPPQLDEVFMQKDFPQRRWNETKTFYSIFAVMFFCCC